jgi:phage-related protein
MLKSRYSSYCRARLRWIAVPVGTGLMMSDYCRDRLYVERQLPQRQTVCWTAVTAETDYVGQQLPQRQTVCWTAVTAETDCMLNSSYCRDRLYVEQQLPQRQTVCWTAVTAETDYVGQQLPQRQTMLNSSYCRDRLYVEQQLLQRQTYVEQHLLQRQTLCWTAVTAGTDYILQQFL